MKIIHEIFKRKVRSDLTNICWGVYPELGTPLHILLILFRLILTNTQLSRHYQLHPKMKNQGPAKLNDSSRIALLATGKLGFKFQFRALSLFLLPSLDIQGAITVIRLSNKWNLGEPAIKHIRERKGDSKGHLESLGLNSTFEHLQPKVKVLWHWTFWEGKNTSI